MYTAHHLLRAAIMIVLCYLFLLAIPAQTAVNDWQKGTSMVPRWDTDFGSDSFKQSLKDLAATKANYVTLIIPLYQSNVWATDVHRGWNTPTDASLKAGIDAAHALGLKVNLKPHLESYDGQWRAHINPGDRQAWFTAYGNLLKHFATIGKNQGVAEMTIGTELINMAANDANGTNTANWNKLIGELRAIFPGKLTYSANWGGPGWTDEKNRITFWPSLDSIGISAYYPLNTHDTSVEGFKKAWEPINNSDITPLQQKFNKPVVFTEIGYRSLSGTHWQPFDFWSGGNPDEGEQARLYEALFQFWNNVPAMQGVHLWEWSTDPNAGGAGSTSFTPQNKQAETVMTNWFSSTGPGSTTPPPPPGSGGSTMGGTATVSPAQPASGQSTTISASVSSKAAQNNVIVDIEIWNSTNQKVFQKFYEGHNFAANETKNYSFTWTAGSTGTYTIKIGMFSSDWGTNIFWNDAVTKFTVTGSSTTPPPTQPPPAATVNIWWPTNNATVSGVQPFKAMVEGMSISDYSLYWSVDNGALNLMGDSQQDYPHKESLVDVGPWRWNGGGPYAIKFIAKTHSGTTIAEKTIMIFVQ